MVPALMSRAVIDEHLHERAARKCSTAAIGIRPACVIGAASLNPDVRHGRVPAHVGKYKRCF